MGEEEMKKIVRMIDSIIKDPENIENINQVKVEVINLCESYPIYKELTS